MTINFMKFVDEYVGKFLITILALFPKKGNVRSDRNIRKILLIKFWGIGSITLSTPLLVQLKKLWPSAEIHYLTLESNAELCSLIIEINYLHTVSLATAATFIRTLMRVILALRKHRLDIVYDLEFFTNISAIVSFLTGTQRRIGFVNSHKKSDKRKLLYTETMEFKGDIHVAKNFLCLANPNAPIVFPEFRSPVAVNVLNPDSLSVILNINAGPLAYERRWDMNEFEQLAGHLIMNHKAHIFIIGSREERGYVGCFASKLKNNNSVTNLSGKLTMAGLVQLIRSSHLVITNDSGPLHIASAMNVPTISLFGPETPLRYGSLSNRHLTFYAGLWCSPCMTVSNLKTVNCINHTQCMKQIRFTEIKSTVDEFVDSLRCSKGSQEIRSMVQMII